MISYCQKCEVTWSKQGPYDHVLLGVVDHTQLLCCCDKSLHVRLFLFEELPDKKSLLLNCSTKESLHIHPTDNCGYPIKKCGCLKDQFSYPIEMFFKLFLLNVLKYIVSRVVSKPGILYVYEALAL